MKLKGKESYNGLCQGWKPGKMRGFAHFLKALQWTETQTRRQSLYPMHSTISLTEFRGLFSMFFGVTNLELGWGPGLAAGFLFSCSRLPTLAFQRVSCVWYWGGSGDGGEV